MSDLTNPVRVEMSAYDAGLRDGMQAILDGLTNRSDLLKPEEVPGVDFAKAAIAEALAIVTRATP